VATDRASTVQARLKRIVNAMSAQLARIRDIGPVGYYGPLFGEVPDSDYWVLTGRERSRHLADKVSASLASTGTPSYFVDAANDLGHFRLLTPKDRVLLFHRRGEPTNRLLRLLRAIPDTVPLDVITDHPEGWPRKPGVLLPVVAPDPLAPEVERDIISLAIGDSLVCGLESARKFTEVEFLKDHPKGSLGKSIAAAQPEGKAGAVKYLSPPEQAFAALADERDGVRTLLDTLDSAAVSGWLELFNRPWTRIITTGMGKPGYCLRYLTVLLGEVGKPAFYLHPAEGVHGDLGRIGPNSLVVAYSHSGETEEVLSILPRMKERGATLISLTNNPESSLGRASDAVLKSGAPEVDPIRKAPTGSTTASLAFMTALACADLPVKPS